jgi:HPt (histidine-containing phosphotransfer) domain-containing protein
MALITDQEMRLKMASIASRFLARTSGEIGELRRLIDSLAVNGITALKDIEVLSHRIRGSGAVFGFANISDAAGEIEILAEKSAADQDWSALELSAQLSPMVEALLREVEQAIKNSPPAPGA